MIKLAAKLNNFLLLISDFVYRIQVFLNVKLYLSDILVQDHLKSNLVNFIRFQQEE